MLSEEAKPQIAERADVGCTGYDIWWAHINALRRSYTWDRQAIHGETRYFGDQNAYCRRLTVASAGSTRWTTTCTAAPSALATR